MRPRDIILKDASRTDTLILEVLLDIRGLLDKESVKVEETKPPLPIVERKKRKKKRKYAKIKVGNSSP